MTESVAIVGFGPRTRELVKDSKVDEIWTCNFAILQDFLPRIDRMFEIHPMWMFNHNNGKKAFERAWKHWEYLQQEHPYPIYLQKLDERVPSGVLYPMEDVCSYIFGNQRPYFSSSFSYMMALAIYENIKRVELYGFEMDLNDTDYRYQRPGAEFMIGVATGRGIEVVIPEGSSICKAPLYGYERLQMILREDLDRGLNQFKNQQETAVAKVNKLRGKYDVTLHLFQQRKIGKDALERAAKELDEAIATMHMSAGAVMATEFFIKEIDLEMPDYELQNPFVKVEA